MHIGEKENWEKFTAWEESCRVPMFWIVPRLTKPGSRCDKPVSLLDIYPTLVELTDTTAPPRQLEGESLVNLLRDPVNGKRVQPAITTHRTSNGLRTQRWRYIFYSDGSNFEELYDHQNDPDEFTNLAYDPKFLNVLEEHRRLMTKYTQLKTPKGKAVPPEKFELLSTGRIRKKNFVSLEDVVKQAIEANKNGSPIPNINIIARSKKKQKF
jgi:arylsulfatase A-like enzyme